MSIYQKYAGHYSCGKPKSSAKENLGSPLAPVEQNNGYPSYLETQFERATSACMSVQVQAEQIASLSGQLVSMEERLGNFTRVVKLLQASVAAQECDGKKLWQTLAEVQQQAERTGRFEPVDSSCSDKRLV